MQELPKVLYKYMPTTRISFFSVPKLRFSRPAEFNDRFDCRLRSMGLFSPQAFMKKAEELFDEQFQLFLKLFVEKTPDLMRPIVAQAMTTTLVESLRRQFRHIYRDGSRQLAPMAEQEQYRLGFISAINNAFNKARLGVLCLTKSSVNQILWERYAINDKGMGHCGFAIGFNTDNKFFDRRLHVKDLLRHLSPVSYQQDRPIPYFTDYLDKNDPDEKFFSDLLYTKDIGWSSEEEWRMAICVPDDPKEKNFGLEDVPIEAINSVYLGLQSKNDLSIAATSFCRRYSIPLFQIKDDPLDCVFKPVVVPLS